LSADQLTLLFCTIGQQSDIFMCTRASMSDPWSPRKSLGPVVNSNWTEVGPCLSPDHQTLYFSSDRPGGQGEKDRWMCRRVKKKVPE
jgi:hypothetical protein